MRSGCDAVGAQVVDIESAKLVGRVVDMLFDGEGCLQGILLVKKHWFGKLPFLPVSSIRSLGDGWVTITGSVQYVNGDDIADAYSLVQGNKRMVGLPVVTANGKEIGLLEDVYIHDQLGKIVAYEVSDGFFADLMEGRTIIERPDLVVFSPDVFIVQEGDQQ